MTDIKQLDSSDHVDATLAALSDRFGARFDITSEQLDQHRAEQKRKGILAGDWCRLCDVPNDTCSSCDAKDFTCNNNHDLICVFCDEGDVCVKEDGSCNLAGDIPCGKDDK